MENENLGKKQHSCNYNLVVIENLIEDCYSKNFEIINVYIDCECSESSPKPFVQFFDSPILSSLDNFKGWFCQIAPWFIQNGYKIIDKRKEKCVNED